MKTSGRKDLWMSELLNSSETKQRNCYFDIKCQKAKVKYFAAMKKEHIVYQKQNV